MPEKDCFPKSSVTEISHGTEPKELDLEQKSRLPHEVVQRKLMARPCFLLFHREGVKMWPSAEGDTQQAERPPDAGAWEPEDTGQAADKCRLPQK